MQLTLLCGSLESGQDGVGDYTRRLARSCREQGVQVNLIALHDRYVKEAQEEHSPLPLLRLPQEMPWPDKLRYLQPIMDSIQPDWISLQYSPYSFHPRGLASPLIPLFQSIGVGRQLHIMFHEIWIGLAPGDPWKHRLAGKWQQRTLQRFLKKNLPSQVHTHTPLYRDQIQKLGYPCDLLPLFGNIDLCTDEDAEAEASGKIREYLPDWRGDNHSYRLLLFFGTLHQEWDPTPFARQLNRSQADLAGNIVVLHVGYNAHPERWKFFTEKLDERIYALLLGPQPAPIISSLLSLANLGLTTTPETHLCKSGTLAAMQEHGLPVIVLRSGEERLPSPYLHPAQLRELLKHIPSRHPSTNTLPAITRQFLHRLKTTDPRQNEPDTGH